ncbi:16653_t:CDS:2 [Cetraspora pellucida]|uniref:16653_t:CDS:1 n=1 Tax=Cetraspora pellucida TaxID=1433469 RepID=A0A9N9HRU1_9GLOM|nr:16653_t:CDS:2 [Cetraspora pellucida]
MIGHYCKLGFVKVLVKLLHGPNDSGTLSAEIEQHQEQGVMCLCTKQIQHHSKDEQGWELK